MMRPQADILERQALEYLMRATSGHATVVDLKELAQWRAQSVAHADAYRRAVDIWSAIGMAAGESVTAEDRAMIAGRSRGRAPALARRALLSGGAVVAAGLVGIALVKPPLDLWPSLPELTADYHTATGEQRKLELADGIGLELNTRTSVSRLPAESGGARIALLSGEALIQTALDPAAPLTVLASAGRVVASTAKFNLRNDANTTRVTCIEGAVRVECSGDATVLHPNEQLVYADERLGAVASVDPANVTAWQRGLLVFRDEPLAEVIGEINRYWRGRIILLNGDLGRRRVTVRIELARIDEIVSFIRSVLGAGVRALPGGVVLLT